MVKNILLPIDGSELSLSAVRYGAKLALSWPTPPTLTLLTINTNPVHSLMGGLVSHPVAQKKFHQAIQEQMDEILATARAECVALGIAKKNCPTLLVTSDLPANAIIQTAQDKDCQLIVMASHGRSGLESLLLGSVTQKVLSLSTIPVLLVRSY